MKMVFWVVFCLDPPRGGLSIFVASGQALALTIGTDSVEAAAPGLFFKTIEAAKKQTSEEKHRSKETTERKQRIMTKT